MNMDGGEFQVVRCSIIYIKQKSLTLISLIDIFCMSQEKISLNFKNALREGFPGDKKTPSETHINPSVS